VGGEGKYEGAVNLNPARTGDLGPIPSLVRGQGEHLPFRRRSADLVTAENVPIHRQNMVEEIAGAVRQGGSVRLVNPADFLPAVEAHQRMIGLLGGSVSQFMDAEGSLHTDIDSAEVKG
jgi:hypothetical protein